MSYFHCIITRFSFRFKPDDPIDKLLSTERLDERIKMFEKYCYASIVNQTGKYFCWIIIIDPLLPNEYKQALQDLIDAHKNSENYDTKGPRDIWLHTWDWDVSTGFRLGEIDWILEYYRRRDIEAGKEWVRPKYLVTTRLDDDDCLVNTFINLVRTEIQKRPKGFRYISFSVGYQHYISKKALRKNRVPMIALGLTLIAEIDKYPMCVYLGCHTHIPRYLKDPDKHPQMKKHYLRNKDYPNSIAIKKKQVQERLHVVRTGGPVWVRNVHDFNLQKNIGRSNGKSQNFENVKKEMKTRFNVDL